MSSRRAITIFGLSRLQARARGYAQAAPRNVAEALTKHAGEVFAESQRRVPVDTGNLKASGRVVGATPSSLIAMVLYGGTAAAYALIVHETHATKSKYLEGPARESAKALTEAIKEAIRGTRVR